MENHLSHFLIFLNLRKSHITETNVLYEAVASEVLRVVEEQLEHRTYLSLSLRLLLLYHNLFFHVRFALNVMYFDE